MSSTVNILSVPLEGLPTNLDNPKNIMSNLLQSSSNLQYLATSATVYFIIDHLEFFQCFCFCNVHQINKLTLNAAAIRFCSLRGDSNMSGCFLPIGNRMFFTSSRILIISFFSNPGKKGLHFFWQFKILSLFSISISTQASY